MPGPPRLPECNTHDGKLSRKHVNLCRITLGGLGDFRAKIREKRHRAGIPQAPNIKRFPGTRPHGFPTNIRRWHRA